MGQTNEGLNGYFSLITLLSGIVTIGAFIQFQDKPPTPPSLSQVQQEKERKRRCEAEEAGDVDALQEMGEDELELNFVALCKRLIKTPGFWQPTAAFVASIAISNNVSAFIGTTLGKAGVENAFEADEFGGVSIGHHVWFHLFRRLCGPVQEVQTSFHCFNYRLYILTDANWRGRSHTRRVRLI